MKTLSYKQRLSLLVHCAVNSPEDGATFPYGFGRYASCAAKCNRKKFNSDWR